MRQVEKVTVGQRGIVDLVNPVNQFRFDRFFVNTLVDAGEIDSRTANHCRLRLVVNAIDEVEKVVEQHPELFSSANPLNQVGVVSNRKGNALLLDYLCYNDYLASEDLSHFRQIAQNSFLTQYVPLLFHQIKQRSKDWNIERGMEILNHSFAATYGSAMPLPGSDLDRYCREHSRDPRCLIGSIPLRTNTGRSLGSDMVVISMMHMDGLIKDEQISSIYDTCLTDIGSGLGLCDVSTNAGIIVSETLEMDKRNQLWSDVLQINGTTSIYGPESPFANVCDGRTPPPICKLVQRFPLAAALTVGLVKHKVLPKKRATEEWEKIHQLMPIFDV